MTVLPLLRAVSGTFDASGSLTLYLGADSFETWDITTTGVFTDDPTSGTVFPEADLYIDVVAATNWRGGTYSGNKDSNDSPFHLERNQRLYCVWSGGTAGRTGTFVVSGTVTIGG